ncbi:TonB-dependent receptor [candidate division WOR-3 bacterium]|nr:TonB-dependent receptor [candidate division WOR-3 bacterium]
MRLKKFGARIGIVIVLFFMVATTLSYSQRLTGKIVGTVTDEEAAPLPGVTVDISSISLMGIRSDVTSDRGTYRFPNLQPGIYKVVFTLEGFQTVERYKIRVMVGGTATVNAILKPRTLEEAITVIAEAPIIDVTKSGMSTNFDRDMIEKIPSGRDSFFGIIQQAPGVIRQSETSFRVMVFGSNAQSNIYLIDGVDISSPELGIAWTWPSEDMIDEVEVLGIGSPAEYGQFTGAVINIVQKSGGNTFNGNAFYYGQYDALTDDNNPDPDKYFSYNRHKFYDTGFTLGGPIVKDKVWFFTAYNRRRDNDSSWQSDPQYFGIADRDLYMLKLSSQITGKHKLVVSGQWFKDNYAGTPTAYDMPETITSDGLTEWSWNILYTWLVSRNSIFELKYGGWWCDEDDGVPTQGGDLNKRLHYDLLTGVASGAPWYAVFWDIARHQASVSFTHFAEDFLAGDHEIKLGVQYNRGWNHGKGGYCGGGFYYDYGGEPYLLYEQQQWQYGGLINAIGAFVDDTWKIGDRLTLNLGLRADYQNADYPEFHRMINWDELDELAPGIDNIITWKSISPRIGLAFQLTPDGKTLLKAHYGRYYDALLAAQFNWPGPGTTDWFAYFWTGTGWELFDMLTGEMGYNIDPDLKNPYADQFSIGLEREIFPDFSIGALFVYKDEKDLLGQEDRGATYEAVQRVSPDNGETYTVYNQVSPAGSNEYWWGNPPEYDVTYRGLIFTLTKKYSNNWMMNTSLTWSKNEGLICTAHTTHQNAMGWYAGSFGRDPTDLVNARGELQSDRRWVFKFQAGYTFPWGILASVNYVYWTGNPYNNFVRVFDLNYVSYKRVFAEPRGKKRFDTLNKLDLRIQKTFNLYSTVRLHVMLDIFNVLNDDAIGDFHSYNLWSDSYGEPRRMIFPRRVQVGVKLQF